MMGAGIAMGADIDREAGGAGREIQFIRTEQEEHVHAGHQVACRHRPLARHEAEIERADAGGRRVEDAERLPTFLDRR
jgi:hypothetical protein